MQFQSATTTTEPALPAGGAVTRTGIFPGGSSADVAPVVAPAKKEPAAAASRELTLVETVAHLLRLLPGKTVATGLANQQLALTLKLDAAALVDLEPFLRTDSQYTPFANTPVALAEAPLNAHILIVEDTLVARLMLRRTLEQLPGCRITEAASGREALAILTRNGPPDLCISDVSMPEMDGLTLLKEIRSSPTLAHLDVMLCTASTERDTVLKAAELNVCRYLLKPFNPTEIKQQVRETLIQSATRQYRKLEELQGRLGLGAEAAVEVLRGLSQQISKDVSAVRTALAGGKHNAAMLTLQGLKGSCSSIKDTALISRIDLVLRHLNADDLTAILDGLELLLSEGKRIAQAADRFTLALANPDLIRAAKAASNS